MKKFWTAIIACVAVLCIALLTISNGSPSGKNLPTGGRNSSVEPPFMNTAILEENASAYNEFSLRLLALLQNGENTLYSPLSTLQGLSITANGAAGNTLSQFENLFDMSAGDMRSYLFSQDTILAKSNNTIQTATSLWISGSRNLKVYDTFTDSCSLWYEAEVFETEFNDNAIREMTDWVSKNTDNTIVSPISIFRNPEGIILLSTLLFDAQWATPFDEGQNFEDMFTGEDGSEQPCTFMASTEDIYLENDHCTGFLKDYTSSGFVFAALLPAEGTTIEHLLSSFDGQSLSDLFTSGTNANVHVTIPKFSAEVSSDLIAPLVEMGITDVFNYERADLSGVAQERLVVTDILQNTCITVDEIGTRAAAVSAVAEFPASVREPAEERWIELDRPFVYLILETNTFTPVFMGTFMIPE